jgi:8-amino-7-oxononanoate synthase|tara:strand:- start:123221 stop:124345 length:1125 start_codon:yes stop_codon:yes gene_type:complete
MQLFSAQYEDLARLGARDRLRRLSPANGKDFSSNDYLALAGSDWLRAAGEAALHDGVAAGSGGSRLLRGNAPEHEALEHAVAQQFGSESTLFFGSGFAANSALFATLPQSGDLVVHDAFVHASAHDGMRHGRAETVAAAHNDASAFEDCIRAWRQGGGTGTPWIAVESLYSMDGDRAPLADLAAIADRHDGILLIDEAHATGVFGDRGEGLAGALEGRPNIIITRTLGKALGCEGALICGPRIVRDFLINRGRPFIFSTAPSPLMARIAMAALRNLEEEPQRRARLHALIAHAESRLSAVGVAPTGSQIMPLILGEDARTMAAAQALQAAGFDIRGIRPPTVPAGTARLRISLTLNVSTAEVDQLADILADLPS